ncbi:MAG: zinc-binding dehydrogenase [Bacteroidota bacterium]|nr:zinc-binding dehydrogenase [Bacteroidota bacterium]
MKAIVLHEIGEPENLRYEDVPDPKPESGEAIVRLRAAALNRRDVWIRTGKYAGIKLPVILGSDGAGEVVAVGNVKDKSWIGRSVVINPTLEWGNDPRVQSPTFRILGLPDNGTYAQFVKIPVINLFPKPANLSFEEAAAIPLASVTAYRAVVTRGQVQAGETVLVTGIGGGVAVAALQIAHSLGANVIVTSGSDEKLERAHALGAIGGVNYHAENGGNTVRSLAGGEGVDVVIDSVGGEMFNRGIDLLKPGGRFVSYGSTTGNAGNLTLRRIFWKQLTVLGSTMGTPEDFSAMLRLYERKTIQPVIDSVVPFEHAREAHRRMEQAQQFGKIVLRIG